MANNDLYKIEVYDHGEESKKVYNFKKELNTSSFLKKMKDSGAEFIKVATIVLDEKKAAGYTYVTENELWKGNDAKGWVYIISVNNKIVKIGQTDATLKSRFNSYQAGTLKARNKGTCSVTNWNCSEFWRTCLHEGLDLKIFAYQVPTTETTLQVFGRQEVARNKHAYLYENALLKEYKDIKGNYPILSNNTSEA